jgi:thiol-disulfide isomerase/thioredoxin/pimeloyl-ACP methyl ester carboxylesterase
MRMHVAGKRRLWRVALIGIVGLFALFCVANRLIWLSRPADAREYAAVTAEWQSTPAPISKATKERLASRCLEIARKYPGTVGGLSAAMFAASHPDTSAGREAQQAVAEQLETVDIAAVAQAFDGSAHDWQTLEPLAPAILARARRSLDHPRAGRLLAAVCTITEPRAREELEPSPLYTEAADLIADRRADSRDVGHFCEGLGFLSNGSQPWAPRFERNLRAILGANRDRAVRCRAQYALASVVQNASEERQAEAEALFEQFCTEFDGSHRYPFQQIEQMLNGLARDQIKELRYRALGTPAPEIAGIDLDGRPLTLSEHRGRVTLLNFWATWCFPCMKLIPHERELTVRFEGQPFDIVGVNCDENIEKAREAVVRTGMTWRSFRDHVGDARAITGDWKVLGYPTVYLIDHHGIIRKRWVGSPTSDELSHMTAVLVDAAQRKVGRDGMHAVVAALPLPSAPKGAVHPPAENSSGSNTGFHDKVFRGADGSESKYVVFVPRDYTGDKAVPAILFLHGTGARGRDGRNQTIGGLAKAIRDRTEDFPFLAIFPQAREDEDWTAESAGGQRALAILKHVQSEYRIDPDRVALTGVSMGGEGTWSLGAAEPGRWSAIVPICHGWKPDQASRLKDLPCWCFHSDVDQPEPSREMIRAIQQAGGKPLYQEFLGVDHNHCADRAYSLPELCEWLLLQNRSRR